MAFKQKTGSPFQRNFGVGSSPAKQTSPMKDTYGNPGSPDDRSHKNYTQHKPDGSHVREEEEETVPTQMKSPAKQTSPMKDTKVAEIDKEPDAVHKDRTKHDPETNEHVFPMKSPVKHSGAEYLEETKGWKKQVSAEDHDDGHKDKYDEDHNPLPMKKSGFKMREGSPMKRNFGIGDTPSPMKKFGVYETNIDDITGEKTTTQVSRDKIKDITSKRDEIDTKIKEIEASYTNENGGLDIDAMQATDEWKNLEKQRTDIADASKKITTTGKDVALEVSQGDVDSFNDAMRILVEENGEEWVKEKYNLDSVKPMTKEQYGTMVGGGQFGRAATEEGTIVKGMIEELQKDKYGKTSFMEGQPGYQRFFIPDKETQLIDENIMSTGVQEGAELARTQGDKRSRYKSTVSSKIMDAIQDKIDKAEKEGKELDFYLSDNEKTMQETYISGLGSGVTTGEWETLQPGGSYNVSGSTLDPETGQYVDSQGYPAGVVSKEGGGQEPATSENVNLYKHPETGLDVTMQELPLAEQGKLIASQKKEETYIDQANTKKEEADAANDAGMVKYNEWREKRGSWDENSGISYDDWQAQDMKKYKELVPQA